MRLRIFVLIALFFLSCKSIAQDMQEGFTYLETGKYAEAEGFFAKILEDYPTNKTARLCYGRAVGLNGNPKEGKELFVALLADHPNDFEVKLNYGEALLWNSEFEKAKAYFEQLIAEDPKSFPALLSYANSLSNLKEYPAALTYVNKALEVLPGNPNALTSKKYMYLGYAYQNQQAQNYSKADSLLQKNLELFPNDSETLVNLANLYLIAAELEKAQETYTLLGEQPENKFTSLNGLALVAHLNGKEKEALALSQKAYDALGDNPSEKDKKATTERYVQALIWNKKFKPADALIGELVNQNPNENWVLALRATLNIYRSDFKDSLIDYNQILENDSTSFDGNLGKANTLKALGKYTDAYTAANNTLKFYTNQKDATNFISKLDNQFTPFYEGKLSYSFDNGDNQAYAVNNLLEFPLSNRFRLLASYNYRKTDNDVTVNEASSNDFNLGLAYQLLPNVTFRSTAGIIAAQANNSDYSQFIADVAFNIKPLKLQTLDVGYKREIQSFNAELLDREIVMNNFYVNYNLSTNFKLGWFTQYFYTTQSDDNTRNLLFTSLYYNILPKPALKAGVNYQYISFSEQLPTIYFSPERFNAGEVFVNIIKDENIALPNEWFYELTAATGIQYVDDEGSQSTYRVQAKLGYKFSERAMVNVFGVRSNIASATAAGFTFTEFGLRFKWLLFKKPIF